MRHLQIGSFLRESRDPGSTGAVAKKITVKLYGKGVFAKNENRPGSENTNYYRRSAGQFIYSKLDFLNGAFGIIPSELDGYETTVDLPCFDFVSDEIDPSWFLFYVSRSEFYSYQGALGNGGRKARRISPSDFLELEIPVPSIIEQKKVAEILFSIDKLSEATRKKKRKIDLILHQAMIDATTPPHGSDWRESTIGNVVEFQGGAQPPRSTFKFAPENGYIRMLQIRDYKSDTKATYIPNDLCKRFCDQEDVMIGRYGPPNFQILRGKKGSYNVALIKASPKDLSVLSKDYLYRFLQRGDLFLLMDTLSQRTSGQQGLDMDALKEFPVFIPDLSTQEHICRSISAIESISHDLDARAKSLNYLKSGISGQLLSGCKRVSV